MELTGQQLEKILNTELAGKDTGYSYYNFASAVLRVLRILAKKAGINENDFSYKTQGTNSLYLTYKNVSFGDATFKKQRGKRRFGSYDWTFKDVFVNLWNEDGYSNYKGLTFQGLLDKIDADLVAQKQKEDDKLALAKKVFQSIKNEINAKDDYEVVYFIDYMNKHKYSLK